MTNPQTDRFVSERDHWHHDLGNTLTVISARTRLQQRMTRRCSGLTDLERTQTLANLEALLAAVEGLSLQIEALLREWQAPARAD
jgi:two-component sensor histidine kinase